MDIGGKKSWFILFDIWLWQFAQELLSTFSTSLGEVALVPSTGGVFVIDITHVVVSTTHTSTQSDGGVLSLTLKDERNIPQTTQTTRLWDRKVDGGFPGMYYLHHSSYASFFFFSFSLRFALPLLFRYTDKRDIPVYWNNQSPPLLNAETKSLKKLVRDIIDPTRDLGHVDGHKAAVTNSTPKNNNIDEAGDLILVAGKDPIVSSTVEERGEEDSSKQQQQIVGQDDVAKFEEGGPAKMQSSQEKRVCDDCAWELHNWNIDLGRTEGRNAGECSANSPKSVVAIETRLGSPLGELRVEWDFNLLCIQLLDSLKLGLCLHSIWDTHQTQRALYLVIRNQGSLLHLICMLNQCQTRHDFSISSYILSQISPFLNFSRKQEYIREAEVEKKYRSVHIRHPPCRHTFTDMPSVTSQISSTIFALNSDQEKGDPRRWGLAKRR